VYASLKLPQNPSGKKDKRKEYITGLTYVAPVASLKTLHEKTQWEKLSKGKKSTTVDARVRSSGPTCDLQGHKLGLWLLGLVSP
jgi:hypothetical protein